MGVRTTHERGSVTRRMEKNKNISAILTVLSADLLSRSSIGLVTLHPLENYIEAKPIKLFEYMAAEFTSLAQIFRYGKRL